MSGSIKDDFISLVYSRAEGLRARLSESDVVELILLLLILRYRSVVLVMESPSQKPPPLDMELFVKWLRESIDNIEDYSPAFKDYLLSICQKAKNIMAADLSVREALHSFCLEFFKLPFENDKIGDLFGECVEWLLFFLAEKNISGAGYSYTPRGIVSLLLKILEPSSGESVYDPACGSAGFLVAADQNAKQNRIASNLRLYGREVVSTTAFIGKTNMLMHGLNEDNVTVGNSFSASNSSDISSKKFDVAVTNPPFSQRDWEVNGCRDFLKYGTPPRTNADYAFIQHILFSLNDRGRGAVIVPAGVLFREGSEKTIRRNMLENHHIETVIAIPPSSFYGTTVPANILILKRSRETSDVLFIDASRFFVKDRNLNRINAESIEKILAIYKSRKDEDGIAKLVPLEDIISNDCNLMVSRYLSYESSENTEPLEALIERHADLEKSLSALQREMRELVEHIVK